jgi:hypothetical protein
MLSACLSGFFNFLCCNSLPNFYLQIRFRILYQLSHKYCRDTMMCSHLGSSFKICWKFFHKEKIFIIQALSSPIRQPRPSVKQQMFFPMLPILIMHLGKSRKVKIVAWNSTAISLFIFLGMNLLCLHFDLYSHFPFLWFGCLNNKGRRKRSYMRIILNVIAEAFES